MAVGLVPVRLECVAPGLLPIQPCGNSQIGALIRYDATSRPLICESLPFRQPPNGRETRVYAWEWGRQVLRMGGVGLFGQVGLPARSRTRSL